MGNALLIYLLGSLLIFGIVSINVHSMVNYGHQNSVDYYSDFYARNLANAVVSMAVTELTDSVKWRVPAAVKMKFWDGEVDYTVRDGVLGPESVVVITATARYASATKPITAYVRPGDLAGGDLPFFAYGMLANQELTINGENNFVEDDANANWNANIHTNDKMTINGKPVKVEGFVTYTNSITISDPAQTTIVPNQNPGGDPVHKKAAAVSIPAFDPDKFKSKAHEVYNGDKTLSGVITLGTQNNPKIIYVGGKLTLSGIVKGHGVIIVKGDVIVSGDVKLDPIDPSNSKLGLYTAGKLEVNGGFTTVHAQALAMGDVMLNAESISYHGTLTSRSQIKMNGKSITVRYKPAAIPLTAPFWGTPQRLKPFAVYE